MKKSFIVYGWRDGESYDSGTPADYTVIVAARDEAEAETLGGDKLATHHDNCEMVIAEEITP